MSPNPPDPTPDTPLDALRTQLLNSGLSHAYINRYLAELIEHRTALLEHALANGLPREDAARIANQRLGPPDTLAYAALQNARHATFSGRHPFLTFGLASFFAVPTAMTAIVLLTVSIITTDPKAPHLFLPPPWLKSIAPTLFTTLEFILPCLLVILLYRGAYRRMLSRTWRIAICAMIALMGALCQMGVRVNPDGHGSFWVAMGVGHYLSELARLSLILLTAWAFAMWSAKKSRGIGVPPMSLTT